MMSAPPTSQPELAQSEPMAPRLDGASIDNLSALQNRTLTRNMNAHVRACCLPPELFTEIFLNMQSIWHPRRKYDSLHGLPHYSSGWMTVLHVCSAWRMVALSAAILWQNINVLQVHPESAADLLTRSAGLPLRLTFEDPTLPRVPGKEKATVPSACLVESVFCRLESLVVSQHVRVVLSELFKHEAPKMRMLIVLGPYSTNPLPNTLGLKPFLQLRRLSLCRCTVPMNSPLFTPALTHLKLANVRLVTEKRNPSITQMLSYLATMSSLEYFHINLSYLLNDTSGPQQKVALSSELRYTALDIRLYFDTPIQPIIRLLEHILIPATASMTICVEFEDDWDYPTFQHMFDTFFADRTQRESYFELELLDDYQWCFYSWNPVAKLRTGTRRLDLPDVRYACDDETDLISIVRPRSLVISSDYMQRLPEEDELQSSYTNNVWTAQDARCLTIVYSDHSYLWPVLSMESPIPILPLLDTIILTSVYRSWGESNADSSHEFEFVENMPTMDERTIDPTVLPGLVSGLIRTIDWRRHVGGIPIQEVRINERLAEWGGWDEVRGVVDLVVV